MCSFITACDRLQQNNKYYKKEVFQCFQIMMITLHLTKSLTNLRFRLLLFTTCSGRVSCPELRLGGVGGFRGMRWRGLFTDDFIGHTGFRMTDFSVTIVVINSFIKMVSDYFFMKFAVILPSISYCSEVNLFFMALFCTRNNSTKSLTISICSFVN